MRYCLALLCCLIAPLAHAQDLRAIVEDHITPRYVALADRTATLAAQAQEDCTPDAPPLIAAYHDAFDAWIGVSHLRFGPSEIEDRAFALSFWPDPRGATPKALGTLIRDEDPVAFDADAFATVSIAARGFYALEFLLFDPQFAGGDYPCALIRAVTGDISRNAAAILDGWQGGYGALISQPGNDTYRTKPEAARQIFTALTTGLEFTSDVRLGRPMGTIDRPRPKRAEARRSGRSLRHVVLSLEATRELGQLISSGDADLDGAFASALDRASALDDPVFAGVSEPQGRLRVEALQQNINTIRTILDAQIGPSLGIAAGFNSLDGD